ncbi:magnesium transporter CorA family protein [Candidatus Saccharibacteria bacterium]|jgi:magnesium transport protein corA|nr:magnesium transporter CorA family protein [Candidatus Saccharibacteria bacterium]
MEATALSDIWRDIETTEPSDRRKLAKELELPDLQARVLVQDRQLSQAIEGDDWLLIQLELPEVKRRDVALRNLTLLLGKSQIVTIHAGALDAEIAERVQTRHRESLTPSLIASIILQYTVEQFTPILNKIDDVTDQLEDTMIRTPQRKQVQQLFMYKRQLADLRKVVLSLMNTLNGLSSGRYELFEERYELYARDSYDYAWRTHELIDTMRDLLTSALDMYLSVVSNRMNDVMKRLTLVTTIFMPISFLTGLGGMNFSQLPFHDDTAFVIIMVLIVVMPLLMVWYFVWKKWL